MPYQVTAETDNVRVRLIGDLSLAESKEARAQAAKLALEYRTTRILVDFQEANSRLSFIDEHELASTHARVLPRGTRIALVTGATGFTDEDVRMAETLSFNYGTTFKFFEDESEAVKWLRGEGKPGQSDHGVDG